MKKWLIILILLLPSTVFAADTKLTALDALTAIADGDLLYIVDITANTFHKITVLDVFDTIDTFAELNTITADKTLVNEEDAATWDALGTFALGIKITGADANPAAAGEIRYDNTIAVMSGGGLRWFDDNSVRLVVDLETDPSTDDYVVAYDAAADGFYMKADADSGGATAWDDIGNPDANDTIDFGAYYAALDVNDFRIGATDTGNYMKIAGNAVTFVGTGDIDLPNDSVDLADMAHADHGDVTWASGAALLDTDSVSDNEIDYTNVTGADLTLTDAGAITSTGTITATVGFDIVGAADIDYGSIDVTDHTFVTDGTGTAEIVLPAGSIDGTEILDDTIDSADYAAGSIDAEHLVADIIDETKIADNGIDSEHYNDGSIDLIHLVAGVYAKDLVTTSPITGAADNIFVGADSDVTIALDFTTAWAFDGNLSIGNATTTAGVLTLLEDDDDGSNFASFMVPALAANTVYTLPSDDGDNTEVLQTDGSGTLTWVANAGGGSTAWDDIGNPDADDAIALAGYEIGFSSTLDEAAHVAFKIDHTDADVIAATTIFQIQSVDNAPANLTYIKIIDDTAGTPNTVFAVTADGAIANDGNITSGGTVEGATLTEGGVAVYNSGETPGGELGGTWASPTIDDSISVSSWTLVSPTFTTGITATDLIDSAHYVAGSIDEEHLNVTNAPGAGEDNYVLTYNHAATNFTWAPDADSGGATAWDDIGDPDAAATVDFVTYTQTIDIGVTDATGGKGLVLEATGLGVGATAVNVLHITTTANDDSSYYPIVIRDDSGVDDDLLAYINHEGSLFTNKRIIFNNQGWIDGTTANNFEFEENSDDFNIYFPGADIDLIWSDGALNLRNAEDGVDAIVEIEGKDAGEKGILRVLSDGDDKYIELYHDDTDAYVSASSGDLYLVATGGDIQIGDENIVTTGTAATGVLTVTGVINTSVGLDTTGAADMDYGSIDVTDHTFVTDGTGTAEIVLPAGSIDGTEILDDTIDSGDYAAASIDAEHLAADAISGMADITSADADYILIWDATDSALKKCDMGEVRGGAGGAPTDADYLVGTANGSLSAEIVVGTTPGGILGGTWASPTIDADAIDSVHYAADSIDNEHINWTDIDNLGNEGLITVADTADATSFVALWESATGDLAAKSDGALLYAADTGTLAATQFSGGGASLTSVDAITGDSATAFFDAGTIEHEYGGIEANISAIADGGVLVGTGAGTMAIRATFLTGGAAGFIKHELGGLEADINAYTGLVAITGGSTAEVDSKSELEGHIADVADFAEADGDVYTGNADFGGGDLELPQASPGVPDADGEIEVDFTDGSVVIQHGSAHAELGAATDVVVGKLVKSFAATIFAPDQVNDVIPIKMIDDLEFPHGIVIVECLLQVGTDSNYTLTLQNYDDFDTINGANGTIDAIAYTAGNNGEVTDTSITYGTIGAGQIIMMSIPSTDVDWIHIEIFYYEPAA